MRAQALYSHPIGFSSGLGFLGIVVLLGLLAGLFLLWSFSCLGGGIVSMVAVV